MIGSYYYYILSSLPYLDIKDSNKFDVSNFFDSISVLLKKEEFYFFKDLESGKLKIGKSKILDSFINFEKSIRHTLAYLRSVELGIQQINYAESFYFSSYYLSILKDIISKENPFLIEFGFDMLKWQYLSDLEIGYYFDFEKLVIYFLKLMIIKRQSLFKEELGKENFNLICKFLIKEANQKNLREDIV